MIITTHSNINLLWGELIIEELSRLGISKICIAPGSRSTPLTIAAASNSNIRVYQHFDERGLGFLALGLAKTHGEMVAIITTSGTAVANLLPAVVEAQLSKVHLLVLSADRPIELIDCGANQAIKQTNMFANYVTDALNLPTASTEVEANYLLKSLDVIIAKGRRFCGPIHINAPFKEPFYPSDEQTDFSTYLSVVNDWLKCKSPFSQQSNTFTWQVDHQRPLNVANKQGIIIIGKQAGQSRESKLALQRWAKQQGWPVFCDCQSSVKDSSDNIHFYDQLLHVHTFKALFNQADVIFQFGGQLISKRLLQAINEYCGDYFLIDDHSQNQDPNHVSAHHIAMKNRQFLQHVDNQQGKSWVKPFTDCNEKMAQWLNDSQHQRPDFSELSVSQKLAELTPQGSCLFLGNSMPVRLFDMFAKVQGNPLEVHTNRGASGIDGLLATFTGMSLASHVPCTTLVIGDTSLLHDLNSLALLKYLDKPSIIVVFNNDGGAIFNLLPIPGSIELREQHYQLPHGLTFEYAAKMFAIDYQTVKSMADFEQHYDHALSKNKACILELNFPANETTDLVKNISHQLQNLAAL